MIFIIALMNGSENKELLQVILGRIRECGRISFAEFMELVLYHPLHGYYQSPREKIGAGGDYYTSPNVHPIFGHLIARQIHEMWRALGRPLLFVIAEMGAGKGLLCSDIVHYCRDHLPDFYEAITYILAEKSPAFRQEQQSLLREFLTDGKIIWLDPDRLLAGEKPFSGCFLSNELVDSFPVHLVQRQEGQLREIYVTHDGKTFLEISDSLSTPALEEYFASHGLPLREEQRAEVNLRALEWMERVSRTLQRGFVLTIDYGFMAAELYTPARRDGTLIGYFRHTTSSNPYQRIGYQDLTSHVNFSALIEKGEAVGLNKIGYTEQYKFLTALGLLQDLEELEKLSTSYSPAEFFRNKLAMRSFLIPEGMGSLFKVLGQSKGLGKLDLRGFQDPFLPPKD